MMPSPVPKCCEQTSKGQSGTLLALHALLAAIFQHDIEPQGLCSFARNRFGDGDADLCSFARKANAQQDGMVVMADLLKPSAITGAGQCLKWPTPT